MKKLSPKQYAQALYESLKEAKDNELKERIGNFLDLVRQKKDIRLLNRIFNNFMDIYQQAEGILDAEVISAKPLILQVRQEILAWIKGYTGRTASIIERTDETLLGGVMIKFGHTVVDTSLKNKLNNLRSYLIK